MDPTSEVYGILWELDNEHLSTLDDQEGVSKKVYRRFEVEVMLTIFSRIIVSALSNMK